MSTLRLTANPIGGSCDELQVIAGDARLETARAAADLA